MTSTPQEVLTGDHALLDKATTAAEHALTYIKNPGAETSQKHLLAYISEVQSDLTDVIAQLNNPPIPPPGPQPTVPTGTFPGPMGLVFTGFNGSAFDETIWTPNEGGSQNGITSHASNVSVASAVDNGVSVQCLALALASATSGANISTLAYGLEVGHYTEARIYVPGDGTVPYNWLAWWTGKLSNWPAAGEADIFEGLGYASCGYQSPASTSNSVEMPGTWTNAFHDYGVYRLPTELQYFWDGALVHTFTTDDNGEPQPLVLTAGHDPDRDELVTGIAGALLAKSVRAWAPA